MARQIPVGDKAVAQVAMTTLFTEVLASQVTGEPTPGECAQLLLDAASRVQFQPSTRRLILTFDLGMSSEDEPAQ